MFEPDRPACHSGRLSPAVRQPKRAGQRASIFDEADHTRLETEGVSHSPEVRCWVDGAVSVSGPHSLEQFSILCRT